MLDVGKRLFASEVGGCNAANHSSTSESEHTIAVSYRPFLPSSMSHHFLHESTDN